MNEEQVWGKSKLLVHSVGLDGLIIVVDSEVGLGRFFGLDDAPDDLVALIDWVLIEVIGSVETNLVVQLAKGVEGCPQPPVGPTRSVITRFGVPGLDRRPSGWSFRSVHGQKGVILNQTDA